LLDDEDATGGIASVGDVERAVEAIGNGDKLDGIRAGRGILREGGGGGE